MRTQKWICRAYFGIDAGQLFKYSIFISLFELSSSILCTRTSIERTIVIAEKPKTTIKHDIFQLVLK